MGHCNESESLMMNIAVITCAVLELEIDALAAEVGGLVHVEKLEQGLHNEPTAFVGRRGDFNRSVV